GKICLARVLRGTIRASDHLEGPRANGKGEKPGGLFYLVGGKKREPTDSASAGEIVAFSKVDGLKLGDSFSTVGHKAPAVEFPHYPSAMFSLAVTPKSRNDEQKIGDALHKLEAEDPTFRVEQVAATHELVVHGMSELHLKVIEARLKRRYGVEITTALPRIAYLETVTRPADASYRHKKQSGGRGQFGDVHLRVERAEKGKGLEFVNAIVGGVIPGQYLPAIEKGVHEIMEHGILARCPVVDCKVTVFDGSFHPVDSSEAAFKIAGREAFKQAFLEARPCLLEPIVNMEIHVPLKFLGDITSDLNSRRARITHMDSKGDEQIIRAVVPEAEIKRYSIELRSLTGGAGTYSVEFSHYEVVPSQLQTQIIKDLEAAHAAREQAIH
ncbi:MAG: elongation factor G, partial [Planctomycetota bacterium]